MKNLLAILSTVLSNMIMFSCITELLRQPSDISVLVGVFLVCMLIIGNTLLIKHLTKNNQ